MAKRKHEYDPAVSNRVKIGKPRTSKVFRKKGNRPSRTSSKGNGSRIRQVMSKPNDRDVFGTPKNRSKTWDAKKSRDPKKDRRKSKREKYDEQLEWIIH